MAAIGAIGPAIGAIEVLLDSRRTLARSTQLSEPRRVTIGLLEKGSIGLSELSEYYRSLLSDYRTRAQNRVGKGLSHDMYQVEVPLLTRQLLPDRAHSSASSLNHSAICRDGPRLSSTEARQQEPGRSSSTTRQLDSPTARQPRQQLDR